MRYNYTYRKTRKQAGGPCLLLYDRVAAALGCVNTPPGPLLMVGLSSPNMVRFQAEREQRLGGKQATNTDTLISCTVRQDYTVNHH